jgi:hypothetical protein
MKKRNLRRALYSHRENRFPNEIPAVNRSQNCALLLLALLLAAHSVFGAPPRRAAQSKVSPLPVRLEILPARAKLAGPKATQRILVMATLADGSRQDVTEQATFASVTPRMATVTEEGEVQAQTDGQAVIKATWKGKTATMTLSIKDARQPVTTSFVDDVVPTLSRLGCNSGQCHGAQQGKGGFKLSLRGYAPELDYLSITRQIGGRRITPGDPEQSLFLRKPLFEMPHRGGKVLDKKRREYGLLLAWLRQGAPGPTGVEAPMAKLEILPGDRMMKPGEKQRLLVRATYADGRVQDVTGRALYATNDLALATVTESGLITMQRAGETAITARYRDKVAVVRVTAPFDQKVSEAAYKTRFNPIDDHVNAKLKQLRIEPSGLCTDEKFLRRACIDAIGTLPTAEEAQAFLADRDPKKRDRLVDALLQRPEYGMIWGLKLGDLCVLRKEYLGRKYAMLLQQWFTDQFNANRAWDKLVTDVLTASGELDQNRGGLFFVSRVPQKPGEGAWIRNPEVTGEMAAQVFLGARTHCAKCHNHPTEKYTQDDYYHFTALWQQVTGKGDNDDGVPAQLAATASGDVRQPRTNALMAPRPLDRSDLHFSKDEDRRAKAVAWMVKQDEFARNIVNHLWARCFGTGIVEPVDDIRSTNPASNEPLMRFLCADLIRHNYDLKYLLGTIMKSATYQRSALPNKTNRTDTRYFSHYPARRLPAEELADALAQVTGVPDRYQSVPIGTRACELADTEIPSVMLDTFGRPPRVQPSDTERTCNPAIAQALALLNSQAIQEKLKSPEGTLPALLKSGKPDAEILETLYLSALSRRPTPTESRTLLELVKKAPNRDEGFQDALWALLNSKEFLFNH